MSKKHFIALAKYLTDQSLIDFCVRDNDRFMIDPQLLREHLANFCHAQNPRFNRERWLDYIVGKCGPSGGKR